MPLSGFPIGASIDLRELSRDPYPIYARLRDSEPVSYVPDLSMYLVTRYDDVRAVLQDTDNYIVGTDASLPFDIFGEHMMTVEGGQHTRYKSAHQKFFLPPEIRRRLETHVHDHAQMLISEFESDGEVELRSRYASRLPILTMLSLFGLDSREEPQLREMYDDFEAALSNFTRDPRVRNRGLESAEKFHTLIQHYLDEKRATAADDSLLALLAATPDRLADEEIRRNALIIFFGGISTVEALILDTLYALGHHPTTMDRIRNDLSLLPKAVTEAIRWLGPVQSATRHVVNRVKLHGVCFEEGDTVNCMLASANRDEQMFEDPEIFNIDRDNAHQHVGFAVGPHHCLGSHLARTEARIAIAELLQRLPGFCLDLSRTTAPEGYEFRQPSAAMGTWPNA